MSIMDITRQTKSLCRFGIATCISKRLELWCKHKLVYGINTPYG